MADMASSHTRNTQKPVSSSRATMRRRRRRSCASRRSCGACCPRRARRAAWLPGWPRWRIRDPGGAGRAAGLPPSRRRPDSDWRRPRVRPRWWRKGARLMQHRAPAPCEVPARQIPILRPQDGRGQGKVRDGRALRARLDAIRSDSPQSSQRARRKKYELEYASGKPPR